MMNKHIVNAKIDSSSAITKVSENKGDNSAPQLSWNEAMRQVQIIHADMGHIGRDQTLRACRDLIEHRKLWIIVKKVVQTCDICQRFKSAVQSNKQREPLFNTTACAPGDVLALDLLSITGKTTRGNIALLCGIDMHTRFGFCVPIRSKSSLTVARALESGILAQSVKMFKCIFTDNGPEFRGKPFKDLLLRYDIDQKFSIPYRPESNGMIERFNQVIKNRLSTVVNGAYRYWDREIYKVVAQYNRTVHGETGRTPVSYYSLNADGPIIRRSLTKEAGSNFRPFEVGQLVLRKIPFFKSEERNKLAPKYQGPYRIIAVVSSVSYRIKSLVDGKTVNLVHYSQLKAYHGEDSSYGGKRLRHYKRREFRRSILLPSEESSTDTSRRENDAESHRARMLKQQLESDSSDDEHQVDESFVPSFVIQKSLQPEDIIINQPSRDVPRRTAVNQRRSVSTPEREHPPPLEVNDQDEVNTSRASYSTIFSGDVSLEDISHNLDLFPEDIANNATSVEENIVSAPHATLHMESKKMVSLAERRHEQNKVMGEIENLVKNCRALVQPRRSERLATKEKLNEATNKVMVSVPAPLRTIDTVARKLAVNIPEQDSQKLLEEGGNAEGILTDILGMLKETRRNVDECIDLSTEENSLMRRDLKHQHDEVIASISDIESSYFEDPMEIITLKLRQLKGKLQLLYDFLLIELTRSVLIYEEPDYLKHNLNSSTISNGTWSGDVHFLDWDLDDEHQDRLEDTIGDQNIHDWKDNYCPAREEFEIEEKKNGKLSPCCKVH